MELLPEGQTPYVKIPVNPDAYVSFKEFQGNEQDPQMKKQFDIDQSEIKQLGLKLQDEIIPEFFIQLEEMEDCPKNSEELVGSFHIRGINIRYLGRITTDVSHNFIKELRLERSLPVH